MSNFKKGKLLRNTWRQSELDFIKNNYKEMSDVELSEALQRHSENSVACKRKRMGLKRPRLQHSFKDVLIAFEKTNYELLSDENDFKDMATNSLKYICPRHRDKGIQTISLGHLESGRGCYWCGREITEAAHRTGFQKSKIEEDIKMCNSKDFTYVETIKIDKRICIGFICNSHPNAGVQYMRRGNMKRDNIIGCKYCLDKKKYKVSKGETKIEEYLKSKNIKYIRQYLFDDCRDVYALPFDFYLTDYNICIEYDGQHHYKPVNFNGISDEEALINHNNTVKHDNTKNEYCKNHNIQLIRIPYWEYKNINNILDNELNN